MLVAIRMWLTEVSITHVPMKPSLYRVSIGMPSNYCSEGQEENE